MTAFKTQNPKQNTVCKAAIRGPQRDVLRIRRVRNRAHGTAYYTVMGGGTGSEIRTKKGGQEPPPRTRRRPAATRRSGKHGPDITAFCLPTLAPENMMDNQTHTRRRERAPPDWHRDRSECLISLRSHGGTRRTIAASVCKVLTSGRLDGRYGAERDGP